VSHSLADRLKASGCAAERVAVVPNGVPVCEVADSAPLPSGTWTLGTVALFRPRKGIEVLIDALALLREKNLPVRLRAVGSFETAEYENEIKRRAQQAGVQSLIDWVGFSRDVRAELARMDVMVLPSLFGEGLPMVVLEAMAAGVPVVATEV